MNNKILAMLQNSNPMRLAIFVISMITIVFVVTVRKYDVAAKLYFTQNILECPKMLGFIFGAMLLVSGLFTGIYFWLRHSNQSRENKNTDILAYLPFIAVFPLTLFYHWVPFDKNVAQILLVYSISLFIVMNVYNFNKASSILSRICKLQFNWERTILYAILAYFLLVSSAAIIRHFSLTTNAYDLGIFDQAIWLYSRFKIPYSSIMLEPLWGDHFSPILMTLAPFYWIVKSPVVLLIAQTGLLAWGGVILFKIAKLELEKPAFIFLGVIAYLLSPYLISANMYDFHAVAFAVPIALGMFYFCLRKKYLPALGMSVLFLMCKEDTFIYLAGFSTIRLAMLVLENRQDKTGIVFHALLTPLAVIYGVIVVLYILPHFNQTSSSHDLDRYLNLGKNFKEVAATLIFNFPYLVKTLFEADRYVYLLKLIASVGLVPLFNLWYLGMALIPVAIILFSRYEIAMQINMQYALPVLPFLFIAYIYGLKRIEKIIKKHQKYLTPLICFLALIILFNAKINEYNPLKQMPSKHDLAAQACLGKIPDQASVSAQGHLVPHLAHREKIYMFPDVRDAQYIILDKRGNHWPMSSEQFNREIDKIESSSEYAVIFAKDDYYIYKRK